MTRNDKTPSPGTETTGHEWDGIQEWNNPLPRWWLYTFYVTIAWGVAYTVAYPAWPLVHGATAGLLGYSTRGAVAAEIADVEQARSGMMDKLANADLTTLSQDPDLQNFAVEAGASVFRANCAQCHGAGAAGNQSGGFPNLLDDDWLWGGSITDIAYTVTNGIRNDSSPDARFSQMPAWGDMLSEQEIDEVVNHVLAISGQDHDAKLAEAGAQLFADNCAGCHGEKGEGMRELGAPNLTDAVWLYGGSPEKIKETVTYARFGVMPAWSEQFRHANGLSQAEINAVATYVHGLGGGE